MKNIVELRENLADNYEKMKANEMELKMGKELANTAGKVINTLKVELEYKKLTNNKDKIPFLISK
jgi:poly(3-hydroxyalkanoate) synthetase